MVFRNQKLLLGALGLKNGHKKFLKALKSKNDLLGSEMDYKDCF